MKTSSILLLAVLIYVSACTPAEAPDNKPNLRALSSAEATVAVANNDFAFHLFREVRQQQGEVNVFLSPLSVSMALAMVLNGASDSTQKSILKTIQFGNLNAEQVDQASKDLTQLLTSMDRMVSLDLANSAWFSSQFTIKKTFSDVIENYFSGKVQALNFADPASVQTINSWVEGKTNHQIKSLLSNISPDEVMFLINAIYFKGSWAQKFDPSQTSTRPFLREDGVVEQVPMMNLTRGQLSVYHNDLFMLIDIPYGNKQFSMTILLPMPGKKVADLGIRLSADSLTSWLSKTDSLTTDLRMPKFKLGWKSDLKQNLKHLGMATKGFPNLIEENVPLEITKVIHQANIEVNEEGSVAAAATSVGIGVTSLPYPTNQIEINKPFVYFIREKHSETILFMGQLFDPAVN